MKRYKAEMWDKMQKIMERYNDHMTHTYLEFESLLDYPILKRAFSIAIDKAPILKCRYREGFFRAYWQEIEDFDASDVISFLETDNPRAESEKFLCGKIDEKNEAQIRVLLVRSHGKDTLNILKNHMVMDGADIKEFTGLVARIYSDLKSGGDGDMPFKNGRRGEEQLYDGFSADERKKLEKLVSYSKKQRDKISFPYQTRKMANLSPFIAKIKADRPLFLAAKKRCKELGYTFNDLIVACFYRAVYACIDISEEQALGVPCMIDLRKYLKNGQSEALTNLTSMIVCHIGSDIGEDIFQTTEKVKKSIDVLKENYPGLHGIPLLRSVFRYTPYTLAKFLIGTFFKNPLMGISNIGIIKKECLDFGGAVPKDILLTGSIKYPPYIQLAVTTYNEEMTFNIASYGTEKDKGNIQKFLERIVQEMLEFAK